MTAGASETSLKAGEREKVCHEPPSTFGGSLEDSSKRSSAATEMPSFDPAAAFDIPKRKPLKVNPIVATFNIVVAFGLIGALITGYVIGLRIFDLGVTSI